jgi:DNA-binding MarR family transcriptional regulator
MPSVLQRQLRQQAGFRSLEQEVLLALQMAAQRTSEPFARHLKAQGDLTPNQYNVLRILRGAGQALLSCSDIAERMVTRDPDITRLLDRLDRQGLITRARNPEDRRAIHVAITPAGLAVLARLDPASDDFPRAVLGHLGRARLESLRDLLGEVIEPSSHTD